jgi:hypothetical protein
VRIRKREIGKTKEQFEVTEDRGKTGYIRFLISLPVGRASLTG